MGPHTRTAGHNTTQTSHRGQQAHSWSVLYSYKCRDEFQTVLSEVPTFVLLYRNSRSLCLHMSNVHVLLSNQIVI